MSTLLLYVIQKIDFLDKSNILQLAYLNILPDLFTHPCNYSHLNYVAAFACIMSCRCYILIQSAYLLIPIMIYTV